MASCFMKLVCCTNFDPEEMVLNIKENKIPEEEYTIDLKVGEETDL